MSSDSHIRLSIKIISPHIHGKRYFSHGVILKKENKLKIVIDPVNILASEWTDFQHIHSSVLKSSLALLCDEGYYCLQGFFEAKAEGL
jgi:hypothetical protein